MNSKKNILPNGYSAHSFIVFQDMVFQNEGSSGRIHSLEELSAILEEPYLEMNCSKLAKNYLRLSQEPVGYYFSLIITAIISDKRLEKLKHLYPSKFDVSQNIDGYGDQEHLAGMAVRAPEIDAIKKNIEEYFDAFTCKDLVPVWVESYNCGCYVDDITCDENEIDGWSEYALGSITKNFPLRFNKFIRIDEFMLSMVGQINELLGQKIFSGARLSRITKTFVQAEYSLRGECANKEMMKAFFNPIIEECKKDTTVENDFYIKHIEIFADRLEKFKIVKRCRNYKCEKLFDYHQKRQYCTEKCAKSARNRRSYQRNQEKRREESRKWINETRKQFRERGERYD